MLEVNFLVALSCEPVKKRLQVRGMLDSGSRTKGHIRKLGLESQETACQEVGKTCQACRNECARSFRRAGAWVQVCVCRVGGRRRFAKSLVLCGEAVNAC